MTDVYHFIPFPSLLVKAGALMYGLACFHPYADGNKRTALMTTTFFLDTNGYHFDIPDTAPDFARDLVARTTDSTDHDPTVEVNRVASWLGGHTRHSFWRRFDYARLVKKAIRLGCSGDVYLSEDLMSRSQAFLSTLEK